jgi:hypothetical protein
MIGIVTAVLFDVGGTLAVLPDSLIGGPGQWYMAGQWYKISL